MSGSCREFETFFNARTRSCRAVRYGAVAVCHASQSPLAELWHSVLIRSASRWRAATLASTERGSKTCKSFCERAAAVREDRVDKTPPLMRQHLSSHTSGNCNPTRRLIPLRRRQRKGELIAKRMSFAAFSRPTLLTRKIVRFSGKPRLVCAAEAPRFTKDAASRSRLQCAPTSLSSSRNSAAPTNSFSCPGLRAPTMAAVTADCRKTHAMATAPGVELCLMPRPRRRSTRSKLRLRSGS